LRYSEVGYLNVIVVTQRYLCIFLASLNRNDLDEEIGPRTWRETRSL